MERYDLIVVGGGPGGSAAAITAARAGRRVLLLERGRFPRHKVCGEFISPEATALLRDLLGGASEQLLSPAPRIDTARFFFETKTVGASLPEPAISVPRFALDAALWSAAIAAGCDCRSETQVDEIARDDGYRVCSGETDWRAAEVVQASGRWSNLTRWPLRPDTHRWIGLKSHYREVPPARSVDLYFFAGGYCGVSAVGVDAINACVMVQAEVASTLEEAFAHHPELWKRSRDWEPLMDPVTTAPLVFRPPQPVGENGVRNVGDAAGFIDPFAGDGIAIALRSGAKAATSGGAAYAAWYEREILPAFRSAARFRQMLAAPRWVRSAALAVLGNRRAAAWAIRATRSRG